MHAFIQSLSSIATFQYALVTWLNICISISLVKGNTKWTESIHLHKNIQMY